MSTGGIPVDQLGKSQSLGGVSSAPPDVKVSEKKVLSKTVSREENVKPKVNQQARRSSLPEMTKTPIRERKLSLPPQGASLPSVKQPPQTTKTSSTPPAHQSPVQSEESTAAEKTFKKKVADAARSFKSKTYGDLKRWVLGQKHKPFPQDLVDRVKQSGDRILPGLMKARNGKLEQLSQLKAQSKDIEADIAKLGKHSTVRAELKILKGKIADQREELKKEVAKVNDTILNDLERYSKTQNDKKRGSINKELEARQKRADDQASKFKSEHSEAKSTADAKVTKLTDQLETQKATYVHAKEVAIPELERKLEQLKTDRDTNASRLKKAHKKDIGKGKPQIAAAEAEYQKQKSELESQLASLKLEQSSYKQDRKSLKSDLKAAQSELKELTEAKELNKKLKNLGKLKARNEKQAAEALKNVPDDFKKEDMNWRNPLKGH